MFFQFAGHKLAGWRAFLAFILGAGILCVIIMLGFFILRFAFSFGLLFGLFFLFFVLPGLVKLFFLSFLSLISRFLFVAPSPFSSQKSGSPQEDAVDVSYKIVK